MPRLSFPVLLHTAAALAAACALAWTLRQGIAYPGTALAFGLLIASGEFLRWGPAHREAAPLGAAGALAYALLGEVGGEPGGPGVGQVVAVVLAAGLAGTAPHVALGREPVPDQLSRRVLCAGFAATCYQPLHSSGTLGEWTGHGPYHALFLLLLLVLTALCDALLCALLSRSRTGWPLGPLLREELRALVGIGSAMCATGAVMALAVAVAGLWALPVICLPLLLSQFACRRYAAVRATYRQTITSLARATEIAGCTPAGHARRVAELSRATGRELGLSEPGLTVLEYAALMHDIGRLSMPDPAPGGEVGPLTAEQRRRVARLGGAVVRQTGVPEEVAVVVERLGDPYREQPLPARVIRAVDDFDTLACGGGPVAGPLSALEGLRLATAETYEPRVVEALARALARNGALL
ncbi:HD-GYP domain-containing protein [Streptomyces sp. Ru87]|uniref:HD-GYP domain-containing protein n=1 Tax=Streptomyces sp. Ru87 TaxID=2044307 RepID=UPI000BF96329|nr:HD domain-containing protein [Streptomyces sp. Ru87]PGH52337.1 metal-dependent phosphohydrolase [Streptomyces sp. Ru87]